MIAFQKVTKKYGRTKVLDAVDLEIKNGEFVSIIGPSGAGKSTLVHILIGAESLTSGHVSVDGYIVNKMNAKELQFFRRRVGVVFQDFKLLKQKSVYENVAFALEVCGYDRKEIEKRVQEVLSVVGLSKQAHNFPSQLSGGEKQRVAMARALVHDPSLIIADEPTGNLDPQNAKELVQLLLKINKEGTTVILTTHNKDIVDLIKKRVVTLQDGKIISDRKSAGYNI